MVSTEQVDDQKDQPDFIFRFPLYLLALNNMKGVLQFRDPGSEDSTFLPVFTDRDNADNYIRARPSSFRDLIPFTIPG
jgi:hypothetical protein